VNKLFEKFKNLVALNSPSMREEEISEFIQKFLIEQNFEISVDLKNNIYAKRGEQNVKTPLFCAHLDTVESTQGIELVESDEKFCTSGNTILGADNKATLGAILQAIEDSPESSFEVLFTVQEETGGGLADFDFSQIQSKLCFIFDSVAPIGTIIQASPFIINFQINVHGKSAHISSKDSGHNALLVGTKIVEEISKLNFVDSSINIGKFTSGESINSIPGEASMSGEIRAYNDQIFNQIKEEIDKIVKLNASDSTIQIELEFDDSSFSIGYSHLDEVINESGILEAYKQLGIEPNTIKSLAVSDANVLNSLGIRTINLGDGVVNAHSKEEFILKKDLVQIYEIILMISKLHQRETI
jgi:tripeptide aminopeptidase